MGNIVSKKYHKENWQIKKLNDVSKKISLNKLKIKQRDYLPNGLFPVVDQGQDLIGGYHNDESLLISEEPPYVVFGDHTKVKKFIPFKFIPGADGVKVLKAKENILPKFLYYLLFTIKIEDKGYARHFQLLEKENFLIPEDLETQQTIVSKIEELFSELDQGIADLKTAQAQLKVYRQSVLKHAFEGKLTNKNVKDGELPQGWEIVKTIDVIKIINNGYTPKKEFLSEGSGEIPFIKVYNLNFNGTLNFKKNPTFITKVIHEKDLKRSICIPGDVLINIVGPPLGKVSIVTDQFPEWNINQAIVMFRPNDNVISKYIAYYMQNAFTINWLEATSKATAGQWNVKVSTCREIPFPYCSVKEQHQIVQEIESRLSVADKMEESIQESLQKAEALRQSILKKAFSGELV
ncbi:restriction endonuclease subunit S [Flavobacterium sp.]|jgi:type I restriction enzyme S subunit|uniref:restriction endonuclease subunit S n=1 Tax=Flavobacterium sp. TaxID=239 RepID=UPI0037BEDAD8